MVAELVFELKLELKLGLRLKLEDVETVLGNAVVERRAETEDPFNVNDAIER